MSAQNRLSQALTSYMQKKGVTQADLAEYLGVDVRTLRRWKNGESTVTDVRELRRLAHLLEVSPEFLGVAHAELPWTGEQLKDLIDRLWGLVGAARSAEAYSVLQRVDPDIAAIEREGQQEVLRWCCLYHHAAGFITSQVTRSFEASLALSHYIKMEEIAAFLQEQELLSIAQTYKGDMLQRLGKIDEASAALEAALGKPVSVRTRGNALQLRGRVSFKQGDLRAFDRMLKEAETLAFTKDSSVDLVRGQFNAGTVYEEYARSLGLLGRLREAMSYYEKAEQYFSSVGEEKRRIPLLATARAMILVYGGEIKEGIKVAGYAIQVCRDTGNTRLLERMYGVQKYLENLSLDIARYAGELRDLLIHKIEY